MNLRIAITGTASGIGRGLAEHFHNLGCKVFTCDKQPCDTPNFTQCDLSTAEGCRKFIEGIEGNSLDALVNNAGFMIRKPPEELTVEEWDQVLHTNLRAPFLLARGLAPKLRNGLGRIVNICSTRARMSEANTESYAASKGGIKALTHCLAVSFGPHITVNCVSPGWINVSDEELREIDHQQHPSGRVGQVKDIVNLVEYLVSEKSAFITGADFVVDGGMTRKMIYED